MTQPIEDQIRDLERRIAAEDRMIDAAKQRRAGLELQLRAVLERARPGLERPLDRD